MRLPMRLPIRQGDILLVPVRVAPPAGRTVPRHPQRGLILAEGEATGHAHAVQEPDATLTETGTADAVECWLIASVPVTLSHEEHAPVMVPTGTYRVVRAREYTPEEVRRIAD